MKSKVSYAMNIVMFVVMLGIMFFTGDSSGGTVSVPLETSSKFCVVDFGMKEGLIKLIENTTANSFEEEIKLTFKCVDKTMPRADIIDEGIRAKDEIKTDIPVEIKAAKGTVQVDTIEGVPIGQKVIIPDKVE